MRRIAAIRLGIALACTGCLMAGCGAGGSAAPILRVPEITPQPVATIVLQLHGPSGPGPAVDSRGRLVAMGETLGHFDEHEDGSIEFTSTEGRSVARAEQDGTIRTPGSILDTQLDSEGRLTFGEDSIYIDDEGRVTGDVAREGLRFEGVTAENRRLAMFCLLLVITFSGDSSGAAPDAAAVPATEAP